MKVQGLYAKSFKLKAFVVFLVIKNYKSTATVAAIQ